MNSERDLKIKSIMSKIWGFPPTPQMVPVWDRTASWLAQAVQEGKSRRELDAHMSRAQLTMKMPSSMAFRKIVDRAIEELRDPPSPEEQDRVQKLNPTSA